MLYLAVALGIEAKPIINYFGLKRDNSIKKIEVFRSERVTLIVTGIGILKSALAMTYVLAGEKIDKNDIFVNFGIAGARESKFDIGDMLLCNKVINSETGKNFYPDMLFKHPFKEGSLESFNSVVEDSKDVVGDIVDMEGAGLAEASSFFFETYQLNFIKVISDYLSGDVDKNHCSSLIENALPKLDEWLKLRESFRVEKEVELEGIEELKFNDLVRSLKLTVTMTQELRALLVYSKLKERSIVEILEEYSKIEIKDKREGKKVFDEIKQKCIK